MRNDRILKGALVATMGSVLAIGAGNVAADNWEDSDSFDVEVEVWEPVDITETSGPDLDDQYVPGQTAEGDFSATIEGEEGATVNVEYTHDGDLDGQDNIDVTVSGDDEDVTIEGDDATAEGEFEADIEDDAEAGVYEQTVTVNADYTAF